MVFVSNDLGKERKIEKKGRKLEKKKKEVEKKEREVEIREKEVEKKEREVESKEEEVEKKRISIDRFTVRVTAIATLITAVSPLGAAIITSRNPAIINFLNKILRVEGIEVIEKKLDTSAPHSSSDSDASASPSSSQELDTSAPPSSSPNSDASAFPSSSPDSDASAFPSSSQELDTSAPPSSSRDSDASASPSSSTDTSSIKVDLASPSQISLLNEDSALEFVQEWVREWSRIYDPPHNRDVEEVIEKMVRVNSPYFKHVVFGKNGVQELLRNEASYSYRNIKVERTSYKEDTENPKITVKISGDYTYSIRSRVRNDGYFEELVTYSLKREGGSWQIYSSRSERG